MAQLLLLTNTMQPSVDVLPALGLLAHNVHIAPSEAATLLNAPAHDVLLVDGRNDLAHARSLTKLLRTTGISAPMLLIVTEGGLAVVHSDWGMDDILLDKVGPAELEARLRLALSKTALEENGSTLIENGNLVIEESSYTAKLDGRRLDLTFKEFELLKFLAQHPGRVFSRQQLVQEVWGYDYFGGTRTVDVHIRRLRAKLGSENEALIGTVRNVGYRFVPARDPFETAGV